MAVKPWYCTNGRRQLRSAEACASGRVDSVTRGNGDGLSAQLGLDQKIFDGETPRAEEPETGHRDGENPGSDLLDRHRRVAKG